MAILTNKSVRTLMILRGRLLLAILQFDCRARKRVLRERVLSLAKMSEAQGFDSIDNLRAFYDFPTQSFNSRFILFIISHNLYIYYILTIFRRIM